MHEGGGKQVGSNKLVELKKKEKKVESSECQGGIDGDTKCLKGK